MKIKGIGKVTYGIIIVVLLIIAGVVAYIYWPREKKAAEPIKIGVELPLTPPGAYMSGAEMKMAMELAVEEINKAGGVLGRNITLIIEDDHGTPEGGVAAMQKLITEHGVVAVVGAFHSSVTLAAMEIAHEHHIPYLTLAPWSNDITAKGYPEVFRLGLCNAIHFTNVATFLVEQNITKAALVVENTDFGLGAADNIKEVLDKHGIEYQMFKLDMGTTDFTPIMGTLKEFNPDAIVNVFTGLAGFTLVSQLYDAGIAPTHDCMLVYPLDEALTPEYWETLGEKGVYMVVYTMFHPAVTLSPKTQKFIQKFQERYNRMATVVCLQAYDGIYVMCEAIKQAGTDPKAIIQSLEKMDYTGVLGRIQFSLGPKEGEPDYMYHNMKNPPDFLLQYTRKGQLSTEAPVIWPSKYATASYTPPP